MNLVEVRAAVFEPEHRRSLENDSQMLYHEPKCVVPVALVCIYAGFVFAVVWLAQSEV